MARHRRRPIQPYTWAAIFVILVFLAIVIYIWGVNGVLGWFLDFLDGGAPDNGGLTPEVTGSP